MKRRLAWLCVVALYAAPALPAAPAPAGVAPAVGASAALTPDFSGVWMPVGTAAGTAAVLRTVEGNRPPLLPDAERLYAERQAARGPQQRKAIDAMARCLPPGVPRIYLQRMPFEVQQEVGAVNMLFQWNRIVRTIELAGARAPAPVPGATYDGTARGRFVGAELRVDTTDYNDATWLDDSGLPHSTKLRTIERWWLDDGGQRLNIDIEFDDPVYYSQIWKASLSFRRLPRATAIEEDVCVERLGLLAPAEAASAAPAAPAAPAPRAAPRTTPRPTPAPRPPAASTSGR